MVEEVANFLMASTPPTFHIATVEDGRPRNRPFGFAKAYEGRLWLCSNNQKKFYKQIEKVPYVEVSAFNPPTGEWVMVHGKVNFNQDKAVKEKAFADCPQLGSLYQSADNPIFVMFSIEGQADFYKFGPDPAPFKTIPVK
jgi:uncharacterized pyridoxamine 5'-phosphate oxidase family protein